MTRHLYPISRFFCSILTLAFLLLMPMISTAQQVKPSLPTGVPEAGQLLRDMKGWQDSLQALNTVTQDLSRLQAALDSLRQEGLEAQELARKSDSLSEAILGQSVVPAELQVTKERLERQLREGKEALATQLMPEELQAALRQLEEAGQMSASGRLPQPPGIAQPPVSADQLKAQAKQAALKAVAEPFTESFDKMGKAKADFNKYKGRVSKVESAKNMPKGLLGPNPLKGKPWQERVVLGSQWQAGKQERFFLDVGPTVAWRFTERLSVGVGGQYRLSMSLKDKPHVGGTEKVGGYSLFSDFEVKSGFFGRLQYEGLSAPVSRVDALTQEEVIGREWVKGLSVGVGKSYTLYKQLRGYALMQYNLLHEKDKTPYLHPLQAKVGFYIFGSDLQSKVKKE